MADDINITIEDVSSDINITMVCATPTKWGEISGVITDQEDLIAIIPTLTSDLTNDSGFITSASVPTALSELTDDSTHRLVTDTQLTVINNTSGTNTGDETTIRIGNLINSATEKETPADTDMLGLMDSEASNILKKFSWGNIKAKLKTYFDSIYALATKVYVMQFFTLTSNPAQNSTYYIGSFPTGLSTSATRRTTIPYAGTIRRATVRVVATAGSSEDSSVYLRVKGTTDYLLSNTFKTDSSTSIAQVSTGIDADVGFGDVVQFKWDTPVTWATPATGVFFSGNIVVEYA